MPNTSPHTASPGANAVDACADCFHHAGDVDAEVRTAWLSQARAHSGDRRTAERDVEVGGVERRRHHAHEQLALARRGCVELDEMRPLAVAVPDDGVHVVSDTT